MKTLEEHNKDKREMYFPRFKTNYPANVKCDDCGTEMGYTNPNAVYTSYPAQQQVQCPKCNKLGYKVV